MKRYKKIILIVSIIVSVISVCQNYGSEKVVIAFLPLLYGAFSQLLPNHLKVGSGLSMMCLVLFIRYVVYTLLFYYQEIDLVIQPYLNQAVFYMAVEIAVIFFVIRMTTRNDSYLFAHAKIIRMSPIIPVLLVILMGIILIRYPGVMANRHFILDSSSINDETSSIRGFISQPVFWGEIIVVAFVFNYCSLRYLKTKHNYWYVLAVLVLLTRCLYYSGHSRMSLLIPVVTTLFILEKVYQSRAKSSMVLIACFGVIAVLVLSSYKFYGEGLSRNVVDFVRLPILAETTNEYFGGVKNVMYGLSAYEYSGQSFIVFINDTFRNVMGISSYFESNPMNSVTIFNKAVYIQAIGQGYDQICPTIIEGMLMFGKFFFVLPTILMVFVVCKLDKSFYLSSSVGKAYIFATVSTLIGWAIPGNYMHMCGSIFNSFLPVYILLTINERFR